MKIVCDNCATKYSIADEKVRGKVFKIRCKKCSHIIVVRGNENGAEANGAAGGHDAFSEESLSAASVSGTASTAPAAGGNADSVWHLVIDREQVGPMTAAEVRAKFAAGEVDVETYAWREGFGDWLRLGSIDDFRDLEAKAPAAAPPSDEGATRRTDAADLFARASAADDADANQDAGADLFGAAGASPAASPAPAAKPAAADVFAPAPASNAFAASEAAPARSARTSSPKLNPAGSDLDGGGGGGAAGATSEQRMAGQRNENSVLFSLNNLQALASGSGAKSGGGGGASAAAKPGVDTRPGYANSQSEGSGLIDIRAMAASTLASSPASSSSSSSSKEEAPTFAAPPIFSPMAAPIMMPAAPTGTPKWVFAVLGVGVLAVVGIIVVGVLLLTRKPEAPPIVAVAPTTPSPTTSPTAPTAPPVGTPAAPTTATPPTAAPAGDAKPGGDAKGAEPASDARDKKGSSSKRDKKGAAKSEGATGAVVPPPSETPKPATSSPGKKRDAIDDLLDGASPDKGKKSAPAAEKSSGGGEDLPDQLDKGAIVGGMSKVKGKVASCYDQFKVPGMANVAVTIAKSGSVSSASVSGAFAGTPTGSCVEKAVKSATFPKFKGSPQSINYPFILR